MTFPARLDPAPAPVPGAVASVTPAPRGTGSPAAGKRPLSAAGPTTPEAGSAWEASHPASGQQPVPAVGDRPAAGTGTKRTRKPPLTGLALLASKMPENGGSGSLEHALIKMLNDDFPGFLRQHNSDSRRAHSGWPDWTIAGPRGVLFRELKRESEKPTDEQQAWLDALSADGANAACWRPSDYYSGRIARELWALAGQGGAG